MTKRQKRNLLRIIISFIIFLLLMVLEHINTFEIRDIVFKIGYLFVYIIIGYDVLKKALVNILHGKIFDENFLMIIATFGAFFINQFPEACAVMLFYQLGEWFQSYAVNKSRKSIKSLMELRPEIAHLNINGKIEDVLADEVNTNDLITVYPGERIPLDGIITKGSSNLDTSSLTGESLLRFVEQDQKVLSGMINLTSNLEIKVTALASESTIQKILDLVENATLKKSKSENFISKFAKWYTPIVVILALIIAVIPSIITKDFHTWIYKSLSFLVVSCPCALVISVPLSFFGGIGLASKNGILIKGSAYLEKLGKINTFVFDKTGTLSTGKFVVTNVYPKENKEEILKNASIAEANSLHPIAVSIKEAYKEINQNISFDDYNITDIPGKGIIAKKEDTIICGNESLMNDYQILYKQTNEVGSIVHVAINNKYLGYIVIEDQIKRESANTISYLNKIGTTYMLSGDNQKICEKVAKSLNINNYESNLLPREKQEKIAKLKNQNNTHVLFCGDGINDAPSLVTADIGVSMGVVGSDAAIEASDIVLIKDDITKIIDAIIISKKTMRIAYTNIVFAISIKILIMILTFFNLSSIWLAIFGDVGVSVIAILNAMRLIFIKKIK